MTPEEESERLRGYQKILRAKAEENQLASQPSTEQPSWHDHQLEKLRREKDDAISKGKDVSTIEQMIQKVEVAKKGIQTIESSQNAEPTQLAEGTTSLIPDDQSSFYGAKPFQPGEHVVWKWEKKVGVFNRHVSQESYITNMRLLFVSHEQRAYNQAPIQMVEAFVISSHTESIGSSNRMYTGVGSLGSWNGSSRTYGTVKFMAAGQVIGSVYVADPRGLVRELNAIKKTTKVFTPKVTPARSATNSKPDMAIELEKLAALFKDGMLTQDEYTKAKEKLLN
ncbi:MAG TPA: SHOCT domain-containing protein [Candidatus Bathyarchaeia archaeon]|nr:SHOCT domain-containing protein [Candidatus Bathyarchaeia archaeon]